MAIKTTIQSLINSLIRTNPALIDKTEHADVEDALLNSLYGTTQSEKDSSGSNVVTTKNTINTSLLYNVYFLKQGRRVTVYGSIQNNSASIVGHTNADNYYFEITNSEYYPSASSLVQFPNGSDFIKFDSNKFYYSSLGASSSKYFTLTYFTIN